MFERGYLTIGNFGRAPIRIHVLTPIGWLFLTGGRFTVPGFLGLFIIVLLHELGHAVAVKLSGAKVNAVDVLPMGGVCRWQGNVSELQRAFIASAGVLAQLALYVCAASYLHFRGDWLNDFWLELLWAFTRYNLYMAAFNLIPFPPFDGAEAWKLFPLLARRASPKLVWPKGGWLKHRRRQKLKARMDALQMQLITLEGRAPNEKSETPTQKWLN